MHTYINIYMLLYVCMASDLKIKQRGNSYKCCTIVLVKEVAKGADSAKFLPTVKLVCLFLYTPTFHLLHLPV